MPSEKSFDTVLNTFNLDKSREKWPRPTDFVFACIGHAFKIDLITVTTYFLTATGIYGVLLYLLVTATCVMPIMLLQSFLGQFSGTGFISVFRIAPLCKGIGFVSLILNLVTLTYYSIFAAVPLFFFLHTLKPVIPWSCEGVNSWLETTKIDLTPCRDPTNWTGHVVMDLPSTQFFSHHMRVPDEFNEDGSYEGHFSWPLLMCTAIIWILVGVVMTRSFDVISKFLRNSCITVCCIIFFFLLRFAFLPGAFSNLLDLLKPRFEYFQSALLTVPNFVFASLGPGWGSILTMASFNEFKANIFHFSWIVCLAHFIIAIGLAFMTKFVEGFLFLNTPEALSFQSANWIWMDLLTIPSALTSIELTRLYTLVFLGMVLLGSLTLIVVQLLSVMASLFDEYPRLRPLKMEVTVASIGMLALISIFSCHNHGLDFFTLLAQISIVSQVALNLLLLVVVLWIYGRKRFQRDLQFMTGRTCPAWLMNVGRFIGPISLTVVLLYEFYESAKPCEGYCSDDSALISIFINVMPWLLIPGYCAVKILQTNGLLKERFRRGLRPADWYPVNPEDRQNYDELVNKAGTAQHLTVNKD